MKHLLLYLLILLFSVPVGIGKTENQVEIKEWPIPWENTRPRDPYVDHKGRVWFCGQTGNYIAVLEPSTGQFIRFQLEEGSYPHNLIVDEDGYVWYAGNQNSHIGKLNPDNGEIEKFPMTDPAAGDPHTLVFSQKGDIWFTVQWGNFIGKLETKTGKIHLIKIPTKGARPYGIKIDPQDRPWIVLFGTNKLATINPHNFEVSEIAIPRTNARPRRLEITSDGKIWFVDYANGLLWQFSPQTKEFQEWTLPGGKGAKPYGTALDDQDRIWIAESGIVPNRLVGFNPKTELFFSISEVPSGGGTIRHMYFHSATQEIWFGTDTNNVGRARIF